MKSEKNNLIVQINNLSMKKFPDSLGVGNNVEVFTKWFDRNNPEKFKLNVFKGIVTSIKRKNSLSCSFRVVKESQRIIIKKTFFLHSPIITEIKKTGQLKKVRRSKLYYYERKLSEKKRSS